MSATSALGKKMCLLLQRLLQFILLLSSLQLKIFCSSNNSCQIRQPIQSVVVLDIPDLSAINDQQDHYELLTITASARNI